MAGVAGMMHWEHSFEKLESWDERGEEKTPSGLMLLPVSGLGRDLGGAGEFGEF